MIERQRIPERLRLPYEELLRKFRDEAVVVDAETGYVATPWVNREIDAKHLSVAAEVVAYEFVDEYPINKVAMVANSGDSLATAIALARPNLKLCPSRKIETGIPGSWKETIYIEEVPSFTTDKVTSLIFPDLHCGDHVLFADDYCAYGSTAGMIAAECFRRGIEPYFAFYVAKDFTEILKPQAGFRLLKQMEILAFAVVVLGDLSENGVTVKPFWQNGFES